MGSLDQVLGLIRRAPRGPRVVACFDYDGTVISGYSAAAFYRHRLRTGRLGPIELARTLAASARGINSEADFGDLLELSLGAWKGCQESELADLGRSLFKDDVGSRLHSEVWQLVQAHRARGHTVVLASSATRFQVEPMAEELGARHLLCTALEARRGVLTGKPAGTPLWGPAKADALRALIEEQGYDAGRSFAYSNGAEDVPLLESVGVPVAVEPDRELRDEACRRDWPVVACRSRGGTPGLLDVARTAGLYAGMSTGFGLGMGMAALRRSRTPLWDVGGSVGSDVGLALAGVDVHVRRGAEHLSSSRPCVFVFNHQSKLDPVIVMKLLRGGYTGVAKKEAKHIPLFGQFFQLAGVVFVDRADREQARKALEPAVAKVRDDGVSLIIAPEGTRSVTPRLGAFKKGAFHIAMQAGVPMVGIVLHNTGEVMWRGAQMVRSGRVEVEILPPFDTSEWSVATLDQHVEHVRGQFLRALGSWPQPTALPVGASA
jgi:putative phosphoserine phosphatase/1-acylglycerol-3-phosphate O-acyltransferase